MDYENFKKEFKKYNENDWTSEDKKYEPFEEWTTDKDFDDKRWLKIVDGYDRSKDTPIEEAVDRVRSIREDIDRFVHERFVGPVDNDGNFYQPEAQNDMVNSPAHYTRGSQEVIDIIEESIQDAPDVKAGMLQAQTLKYLLRLWLKGNAPQDSEKARWYLNRLIEHLNSTAFEE